MTASIMARRHTAAGPNPEDQEQRMADYRTYERIINAVNGGHIYRNDDHEYVDRRTGRNVTTTVYAIEDRRHLALAYDGGITVTEAGGKWLNRDRHPGPAANTANVTFKSPAVA